MSFFDLQLDVELIQGLADNNFVDATQVQREAVPTILEGGDLLASAPTGSGKTLAFVLPALQHILDTSDDPSNSPRVLILSPTRDLALQTQNTLTQVASLTEIRSSLFVGGTPYGNQQAALESGLDIMVATPGRLLELLQREWVDLSLINFFIVDEADRMMDMGFIDDLLAINKQLPKTRQTLMFSATLEKQALGNLAKQLLNDEAKTLQLAAPRAVAAKLTEKVYFADNDEHKAALLEGLLKQPNIEQALVFVGSRKQVDVWVAAIRKHGYQCDGLHGELPQGARTARVKRMRRGHTKVLVATDIAARGLEMLKVSHVINLSLPIKGDIYVHRAGRCGRGDRPGQVWSIVDALDFANLGRIERYTQNKIKRAKLEGLEPKKPEPKVLKKSKPKKKASGKKAPSKKVAPKKKPAK
ncbi:MAG: DEAD/DEAH box helicase [Pontibacterium sp.]